MGFVRYFKFNSEEGRLSRSPEFSVLAIPAPFLLCLGNPTTSLVISAAISLLLIAKGHLRCTVSVNARCKSLLS